MPNHPTTLPDALARKISDLATAHGYGVEVLTLSWWTDGIGNPAVARVTYESDFPKMEYLRGDD